MTPPTRRALLGALALGSVSVAGCLGDDGDGDGPSADSVGATDGGDETDADAAAWATTPLEDVLTGETFVVEDFDRPVLLETFAVWCSTCLAQQRAANELHERVGDDVVTVALNVDQNEDAEAVRTHAEEHGFDWYWAVSPPAVTRSLTDQFGQTMASPPSAPVVLRCTGGGARRLEDGVKSADTLATEVDAGC